MKRKVKTLVILAFLVSVLFSILFFAIHETNLEKNRQILRDNSDKYELYLDGEQIDSIDDVDLYSLNYIIIDDESGIARMYTNILMKIAKGVDYGILSDEQES